MALRILQKFKSDFPSEPTLSYITVVSAYCPESRVDLKSLFEEMSEEGIFVDFVLGQMGQVLEEECFSDSSEACSLRTDLSDFALLCMYNCNFSQVQVPTLLIFHLYCRQ